MIWFGMRAYMCVGGGSTLSDGGKRLLGRKFDDFTPAPEIFSRTCTMNRFRYFINTTILMVPINIVRLTACEKNARGQKLLINLFHEFFISLAAHNRYKLETYK